MAKVKYGEIVVDMRGKLGGHVHSRNRSGNYTRTKVTPNNPQTTFQSTVRNRLGTQSSAWSGLTAVQRSAWNSAVDDFAKTNVFGDKVRPSGKNLYASLNNNLDSVGVTAISLPPLPAAVEPMSGVAITISLAGTYSVTHAGTTGASDIQIWATPGLSQGTSNANNKFRLLQAIDGATASPEDIKTAYDLRFGAPTLGTKVFVKLVVINSTTGQAGVAVSAFGTVAA